MKKNLTVFAAGGLIYPAIEILWRGYSHISMAAAGGISLFLINKLCCEKLAAKRLYQKCIAGSLIITGVELATGLFVNKLLMLNVWDYSDMPYNVFGQICIPFSIIWFFISIPAIFLCEKIGKILSGKEKNEPASASSFE